MQLRGDTSGFQLDIQLSAHPDSHQRSLLAEMAKASGLALVQSTDRVWQAREELISKTTGALLKISASISSTTRISDEIVNEGGQVVAQTVGILYATFPAALDNPSTLPASLELLGLSVSADQGYATWLRGPDKQAKEMESWAPMQQGGENVSGTAALMREIKRQFDPNRTLNPGRFIGGI